MQLCVHRLKNFQISVSKREDQQKMHLLENGQVSKGRELFPCSSLFYPGPCPVCPEAGKDCALSLLTPLPIVFGNILKTLPELRFTNLLAVSQSSEVGNQDSPSHMTSTRAVSASIPCSRSGMEGYTLSLPVTTAYMTKE